MNFIIFKDFFGIFLNLFYEFNSIYYKLNKEQTNFLLCADMATDVARMKTAVSRGDT